MVEAQCEDNPAESTCYTCHQKAYPVDGKGEWHDIHARKDCCWNCHGGNAQAEDKDQAHSGMLSDPLEDIYTDCYACHPFDYEDRAERFAALLGVEPGSSAPPPQPEPPLSTEREDLRLVILTPPEPEPVSLVPWMPEFGMLLLLGLILGGFAWLERRRSF
jgi:hypothetical protein